VCEDCEARTLGDPARRKFLGNVAMLAGGAFIGLRPEHALADVCTPFLPAQQTETTAEQAIQLLAEGNARFAAGASVNCDLVAAIKASSEKQAPFACVLACIDSRSAPELLFDQQIGDIFVARVAGNIATAEVIGSFEYATKVAGAKAIVVLGHSHCGAVKGAVDKADAGENLTTLLNYIEPAVAATPLTGERSSQNHPFVEAVAEANVRIAVAALTDKSPTIKRLVDAGTVKIVGAMYDIESGKVTFQA
jgi:carbonic anhydrase